MGTGVLFFFLNVFWFCWRYLVLLKLAIIADLLLAAVLLFIVDNVSVG
jgi:hypothetical protein